MINTERAYIQKNGDLLVFYYYGERVLIPRKVMMKYREEQKLREKRDEIEEQKREKEDGY